MNYKQILILALSVCTIEICSQHFDISSTSSSAEDSVYIMQSLKLARNLYGDQKYDSVVIQTEKIVEESFDLNFRRGAGEAYFLKARALNRLNMKTKAIEYYQLAITEFQTISDHRRLASVYNNWGLTLKAMSNFREAIRIGELALSHVQYTKDEKLRFHILNNLGNSYQKIALFRKASASYFESLNVLNQETDSVYKANMQAEVNINLGLVYIEQKLYKKSEEIYLRVLDLFEEDYKNPKLVSIYNNLGILYTHTQDYRKAISYLNSAFDLAQNLGSPIEAAVCRSNMGKVHLAQDESERAIQTYEQSILELQRLQALAFLPSSYLGLGETYIAAGKYMDAQLALTKGLSIALKSGQKIKELKLYEAFISLHKSLGELEMALMYYDLYSALSHELNDQQIGRFIGQMELAGLIKKRDDALKILENEASYLQFQLNQRNVLFILSLTIAGLVSGVFVLVVYQQRLKNKNRTISLEHKILRTQLNPHFLFNALAAIQHYLMHNTPEKGAFYLAKFSSLMRSILECSRASTTSLTVEVENMKNYLDLQSLRFTKEFNYKIEIAEGIATDLIQIPSLFLQPLLENSIEHGLIPRQGGAIITKISEHKEQIVITIEDDGVGINSKEKSFKFNTSKVSFGNTIIRERMSLINRYRKNKIELEIVDRSNISPNLSGTKTTIKIPIS